MSENREEEIVKALSGSVSGLDGLLCLSIVGDNLETIRRVTNESIKGNDAVEGLIKSSQVFNATELAFEMRGGNLEALLDSLENEQMKEDCKNAIILIMSGKSPADVGAMTLLLKGVIMPLAEELKNARQTIESLMIATGKKEVKA